VACRAPRTLYAWRLSSRRTSSKRCAKWRILSNGSGAMSVSRRGRRRRQPARLPKSHPPGVWLHWSSTTACRRSWIVSAGWRNAAAPDPEPERRASARIVGARRERPSSVLSRRSVRPGRPPRRQRRQQGGRADGSCPLVGPNRCAARPLGTGYLIRFGQAMSSPPPPMGGRARHRGGHDPPESREPPSRRSTRRGWRPRARQTREMERVDPWVASSGPPPGASRHRLSISPAAIGRWACPSHRALTAAEAAGRGPLRIG